jgi:hypothetical protein
MDGVCGMHGRGEEFVQNSGKKSLNGRYYLQYLDVDGRLI